MHKVVVLMSIPRTYDINTRIPSTTYELKSNDQIVIGSRIKTNYHTEFCYDIIITSIINPNHYIE